MLLTPPTRYVSTSSESGKGQEKAFLTRLLQCCDLEGSPKTRLNAFWKVILKEFKEFVCKEVRTKLERSIGTSKFFDEEGSDMIK